MKLRVICGVLDGGKPCGKKLGALDVPGFPGPEWFRAGNYPSLRWEDRHYKCPKHGAVQIHETDLLHRALLDLRRPVLLATGPIRVDP